uniref:glycerophosphodiester phosphodiesterase family protein n=1 Tax=uncultured Draconibacterium sp. TaxID=1573823 RepID=UPI00321767CA
MGKLPFILLLFVAFIGLSCEKDDPAKPVSGKLFMVAGQSNAVGVGDKNLSEKTELNTAFEYNAETNEFEQLNDPVGSSYLGFQKAEDGSFVPAFAKAFYETSNEAVYVVMAAKGGSACHNLAETNNWGNWSTSGSLFENSVLKARKAEEKSGLSLSGIIWSQGENDGAAISQGLISKEDYKNSLTDLIARYRREFGEKLTFGIIETGRNNENPEADKGFAIVREVQREVAKEDPFTHIFYAKTEKFPEYNLMVDAVHYNQTALNDIGAEIAKSFKIIFNGLKPTPCHGTMVIAHRGASAFAPENTMASVNLAWEMGASAVEIDIHLSKDNRIMVCHDENTKRVSGKDYLIANTSSEVLRSLDVGSTFSSQYANEKIPFLEEVIETIPEGKFLFVEIKCPETVVPFLKKVIEESGKQSQIKIISFSVNALLASKNQIPQIPVFWLVCPPYKNGIMYDLINKSDSYGFDGLDINYGLLTNESNEILKELNRYVYVWTVNKTSDAERFDSYNVYGITTDKPDILK